MYIFACWCSDCLIKFLSHYGVSSELLSSDEMPKKIEWVGDIAVIPPTCFLNEKWYCGNVSAENVNSFWKGVAMALNANRVAKAGRIDAGLKRQSTMKLMWSDEAFIKKGGWVTIVQQEIKYSFDMTKVMFSSGNCTERIRMGNLNARYNLILITILSSSCPIFTLYISASGEVVVDFFCGIGYFTIPLLYHGKAAHVHACEWNPDSLEV
jgi:tRNA G37 N-methylase Trm5